MVRPESIHVAEPDGGSGTRSLKGRIVQTSFLGSQTRIAVRCDAVAAPLTVFAIRSRAHRRTRPGPGQGGVTLVGPRRRSAAAGGNNRKRRATDVSLTEGQLDRADLLKAGAAGALGLYLARPASRRRCVLETHDAQLAHLVRSLRERPAQGRQQDDRAPGPADALQRQRRRVPEDQADRQPVRHRLGRRALGARSTTRTG